VEQLEVVELLAGRREGDRPADHLFHRQGGAAAGVAVQLGEDDTVELEGLMERLGNADGVLTGHGVDDEERVVRADLVGDAANLAHQLGINGQTAGGVDDHHVATGAAGLGQGSGGDHHRIADARRDHIVGGGVHRHVHLGGQGAQLGDGSGPLKVGTDQHRVAALGLEPAGQLGRVGRLAGTLKAGHQHDGRRLGGEADADRFTAERGGELLVDDLDDLLSGVERPGQLLAHRPLADAALQRLDDGQVDVGFQQRQADFSQHLVDVGLGELPLAAQLGEDAFKTVGQ